MERRTRAGQALDTETDDQLSEQLTSVLAAARRRAARDGDRQVDTAHLLHSLLETDREVWEFLDGGSPQAGKLLGYLVQRSIGYGLRWQGTVEDSGALPRAEEQSGSGPYWSPTAVAALAAALDRARSRGGEQVEGVDLFAGVVADSECRGVEVLEHAGVDTHRLGVRLGVRAPHQRASGA